MGENAVESPSAHGIQIWLPDHFLFNKNKENNKPGERKLESLQRTPRNSTWEQETQ